MGYYPPSGYPPPGHYQQPPNKMPVWPWVLGGCVLIVFLGVGGCFAFVGLVATGIHMESNREVRVTYQVEGVGDAVAVTYSGRNFNTAQDTDVSLPWTKDVTVAGLGKTVVLTATSGASGQTITCRILADGKKVSEQTSNGPFATANCIGNAGQR
jgi:Mycobacterium membrane protein